MSSFPKRKRPHNMRVLPCTEVFEGEENARVHDLMDLLLARDLLAPEDLRRVREACTAIFDNRQKQTWPPQLTIYRSWAETYAPLRLWILKRPTPSGVGLLPLLALAARYWIV